MLTTFVLPDSRSSADLALFLTRAARVAEAQAWFFAKGTVLAVYVPVLQRAGLLDSMPTVLGLRTFQLAEPTELDAVVSTPSIIAALSGPEGAGAPTNRPADGDGPVGVLVPRDRLAVAWTGVAPPRGNWARVGTLEREAMQQAAKDGIAMVAEVVPTGTGEQLVHKARTEVWSQILEHRVPAGVAFAMDGLGFWAASDTADVFESGAWRRVSTPLGHVLTR